MSIEKDELLLLHSSGVLCVKASNAALKNNRQMRVKSLHTRKYSPLANYTRMCYHIVIVPKP